MSETQAPHELLPQHKPEFDGGSFIIEYLSTSPNGFEVVTDKSGRRRDQITPTTRIPIPLDRDQRGQLKRAMVGQMRFAHGDKAHEALLKLRSASDQDRKQTALDYEEKRKIYLERNAGRVGLRNIRQQNNTLIVDIKPVDFPTYKEFSKPGSSDELLELAAISSTSMALITKDRKLIIQRRSPKNSLYGDVPGASVAGFLDGRPYYSSPTESAADKRGTLRPIDTDFVKDNIIREANEELGLDQKDFSNLRIVGLTHENVQIHDEFILLATTSVTVEEMKEKAQNASRSRKLSDQEFEEKFVDISATPETISTLLTQVKCPIPPTHIAVFVAAGYSLVLQEKGLEETNKWKDQMQERVRKNYQEIDQIVAKYYQDHPEELNNIPQGKPSRNPRGYEPAYLPSQQGLPDFTSELIRLGLTDSDDIIKTPEIMKTVDHMLIMDVDGVITNPQEKRITEPEILDQIAKRLEKGEPVALNTGRSVEWMKNRILNPLAQIVKDKKMLINFLAVAEKGGAWAEFDEEGNIIESKDDSISVPDNLKEEIRNIVNIQYSDTMFFDESKLTMISTEMKDGHPLEDYREKQRTLVSQLKTLLANKGLEDNLKIDPTTIAIDIENKHVGKHFAVKRIIEWLKNKGISPKRYIAFGDTFKSDIPMAEEIHSQGLLVEFVYVGKENIQTSDYPFPINQPIAHFGNGTLEYLKSL